MATASERTDLPKKYGYKVVKSYPHDDTAFTQGLIIHEGKLYEGTGQNGKSQLRLVDLASGRILKQYALPNRYFGEGIAAIDGYIYQLTWESGLAIIYDRNTLQPRTTLRYGGEGWGLTYDGKQLIMSDGTSVLRFLDPRTFRVLKKLRVRMQGRDVKELNELEYINGEIWANIWHQDQIVRIDPASGQVISIVDLSGLNPVSGPFSKEKVLNGIAYDASTKKIYVTGKHWPKLFEIEVIEKSP